MNEQTRIITESQWKEYQDLKETNRKLRVALRSVEVQAAALFTCKEDIEGVVGRLENLCSESLGVIK